MKHFTDALFEGIFNEEVGQPECEYCGTKLDTPASKCKKCGGQAKATSAACKCNDCGRLQSTNEIANEKGKLTCKGCGSDDFTLPKETSIHTVTCNFCDGVYLKNKVKGKCPECGGDLK